jgi:aminoglycoside phosphotransferase (APT) family kinase protein
VTELRDIDVPVGAPPGGRRPLRELDAVTRAAIGSARGVIDADAALAAWDHALQAPAWEGAPVWIHSDLLRLNLLVRDASRSAPWIRSSSTSSREVVAVQRTTLVTTQ